MMFFFLIDTIIFAKRNYIFLRYKKKTSTMGNLVVIGLGELRTLFGAYEQFIGRLWNVFGTL